MGQEIVTGMAEAIEARRKQLGLSPTQLAEATGLSSTGLAALRRGIRKRYQDRLTGPVTRVLQWTPDSIERLLDGKHAVAVRMLPDDPENVYPLRAEYESLNQRAMDLVVEQLGGEITPTTRETHPAQMEAIDEITRRMNEITWQIKQLRGEAPLPPTEAHPGEQPDWARVVGTRTPAGVRLSIQAYIADAEARLNSQIAELRSQVTALAGEVQRLQRVQEAEMGEIEDPAAPVAPSRAVR